MGGVHGPRLLDNSNLTNESVMSLVVECTGTTTANTRSVVGWQAMQQTSS